MPYPKMNNENFVGIVIPDNLRKKWHLVRQPDRRGIKKAISNKSVWVVGSSFPEDERIAIFTQKLLREHNIRKLLVLVPRFPNRVKELLETLKDFNVRVHSKGEIPSTKIPKMRWRARNLKQRVVNIFRLKFENEHFLRFLFFYE